MSGGSRTTFVPFCPALVQYWLVWWFDGFMSSIALDVYRWCNSNNIKKNKLRSATPLAGGFCFFFVSFFLQIIIYNKFGLLWHCDKFCSFTLGIIRRWSHSVTSASKKRNNKQAIYSSEISSCFCYFLADPGKALQTRLLYKHWCRHSLICLCKNIFTAQPSLNCLRWCFQL